MNEKLTRPEDAEIYVERTHDKSIYLNEDRYDDPKEIHKTIAQFALDSGGLQKPSLVCDFGCAAGEFLHYLAGRFPEGTYRGYDIIPEFIDKAKARVPEIDFEIGSVLDRTLLSADSIDIATLIGVHAMYDEIDSWLSNLIHWTKPGGRIYVFGPFNAYPVDMWMTCRKVDDPDPNHREIGWNLVSKASLALYLDAAVGKGKYRFIPFEMPFDLHPVPEDPLRSWTFLDGDGHRLLMNGLSIILNFETLEISP